MVPTGKPQQAILEGLNQQVVNIAEFGLLKLRYGRIEVPVEWELCSGFHNFIEDLTHAHYIVS